jgi:hypothetical protein
MALLLFRGIRFFFFIWNGRLIGACADGHIAIVDTVVVDEVIMPGKIIEAIWRVHLDMCPIGDLDVFIGTEDGALAAPVFKVFQWVLPSVIEVQIDFFSHDLAPQNPRCFSLSET